MTTPTVIAEAIHELELYDAQEHRAVLKLVREILATASDLDEIATDDVH